DYFFVQRQVLAWRYLAAGCHPAPGQQGCRLAKAQFGVLVPRQRASALVSMEYVGREKVVVKGAERELNRFKLESDGSEWGLWFDDQHRLVRVIIAAQNTEVLRDCSKAAGSKSKHPLTFRGRFTGASIPRKLGPAHD